MTADWLFRFIALGIIGLVAGVITASMAIYDFAAFFLLLSVVGWAGTWYMIRHNPIRD